MHILIILAIVALTSCQNTKKTNQSDHNHGGHNHGDDAHHTPHPHHAPQNVVTSVGQNTIFLAKFNPLVKQQGETLTIMATRRKDHQAIQSGKIEVALADGDKPKEVFIASPQTSAGTFSIKLAPKHSAKRTITVTLRSAMANDTVTLGQFDVFASKDDAKIQAPEPSNVITVNMDQQWQTPFGVQQAQNRNMRPSIPTFGQLKGLNPTAVVANEDGKLNPLNQRTLQVGENIKANAALFALNNSTVISPTAGTITMLPVQPGATVKKGQVLAQILNDQQLHLHIDLPETYLSKLKTVTGAWFTIDGYPNAFQLKQQALISMTRVINPKTRTMPIVFRVDNMRSELFAGTFARVHLYTDQPQLTTTVHKDAIIDDNGVDVVFVQLAAEHFERRPVKLGVRDGDAIEVLSGVKQGEWVVTNGGYSVKLAATPTNSFGHGHAH